MSHYKTKPIDVPLQDLSKSAKKQQIQRFAFIKPKSPLEVTPCDDPGLHSPDVFIKSKKKLLHIIKNVEKDFYLYTPQQKKQLSQAAHGLLHSLEHFSPEGDLLDFKLTVFGKAFLENKTLSPLRTTEKKAEMIERICQVIVNPFEHFPSFRGFVETLKKDYPKSLARNENIAYLTRLCGIVGIAMCVVLAPLTGFFSLLGLAPAITLWVKGLRDKDESKLICERNWLEMIAAIGDTFAGDNPYENLKRNLYHHAELLKYDGDKKTQPTPSIGEELKEQITNLINDIDRTTLPENEKQEILTEVDKIMADPNNPAKAEAFGDFITMKQKQYPVGDAAICKSKQKRAVCLAALGCIACLVLAPFSMGASLVGLVIFPVAAYKYFKLIDNDLALAHTKNDLNNISSSVASFSKSWSP